MSKEAKKSKSSRITGKLILAIASITILSLFIFSFTSCCNLSSLASKLIKTKDLSKSESTAKESIDNSGSTSAAEGDSAGGQTTSASEAAEAPPAGPSGSDAGSKEYSSCIF